MKRLQKFAFLLLILLGLGMSLTLSPLSAQETDSAAPVVVSGREIFKVTPSDRLTADERAEWINLQLEKAVKAEQNANVTLEERNNSPTLVVNGRYLLTVTEEDTENDRTPREQADIWENRLETALQQAQKDREPTYIRNRMILAAILLGLAIVVHWGMIPLGHYFIEWSLQRRDSWRDNSSEDNNPEFSQQNFPNLFLLFRLFIFLGRIALWVTVLLYIASLFSISRQWSYWLLESLQTTFTAPLINLGNDSYSILDFLILLGLFWGLLLATSSVTQVIKNRILRLTRIERGIQEAISIVIKYSLMTLGAIILLQIWGLNLSSIAILGSALGVGIGFGFQDIAKNFASGLVLLFERSVQVGDFIEVNDRIGTVERVGARSIVLRTLDQISVIVPNSRLLEDEVINWSHDNPISRLHIPVGVAYGSNIQIVRNVLLQAAKEHSLVLDYPNPTVHFKGFGDSSLDFDLLVWSHEPSEQINISSDLYFRIEELLRQSDVEIPFPQRDLHLRSGLSPQLEAVLLRVFGNSDVGDTPPHDAN
ncbi:mechanosensitive ion channel [Spirulina sp. CS-785/01]|uniref:mechanosensitive ion channel family protein n=1 Tax=Spirulina sp. CS-785/01 TaxID=3021716 RepID=UPI00232E545E|nr:mechanosensitive ion channel domain-containing protein [Spirulina sp. CS-785/01]MDB9312056.1 mechanosensitive ion channel [Spirulina sp. CS-785/01]